MIAALAMMFSIMTSYTRARAESLIEKCKVGFMERPERIVLFMIGAFTNRMAAVLWVILVLSIVTVANRIYYTYLELNAAADAATATGFRLASGAPSSGATSARRSPTTFWVIAILAFVWLTPPDWLRRPRVHLAAHLAQLVDLVDGPDLGGVMQRVHHQPLLVRADGDQVLAAVDGHLADAGLARMPSRITA
jgi:hypothetical protein